MQEIKCTLATHLPLRLPFRRNASFTRPGFGPTDSVRLSLDIVSFSQEWKSSSSTMLQVLLIDMFKHFGFIYPVASMGSPNTAVSVKY